jgi:protein gp37
MFTALKRWKKDPKHVRRCSTRTFNKPLRIKKPALVFTCSFSDFFHHRADAWRAEAWAIIKATPHLTYQILTKRPERILANLPPDWGTGYPNVWLGTTVEDQKTANKRIPLLAKVPAALKFLSVEPLLEEVTLFHNELQSVTWQVVDGNGDELPHSVDWIIIGGESGHSARELKINWVQKLITQGRIGMIPVFVKQLGSVQAKALKLKDKKGGDFNEWPMELRVRQFPF